MTLELGPARIDVDVERTRAFYEGVASVDGGCSCVDCRNFGKAMESGAVPEAVRRWFEAIGVDLRSPAEIYALGDISLYGEKAQLYGGFYHVCGGVLLPERKIRHISDRLIPDTSDCSLELAQGYSVCLSGECELLRQGFPRPCFQLNISFLLPWLLDEPNYDIGPKE